MKRFRIIRGAAFGGDPARLSLPRQILRLARAWKTSVLNVIKVTLSDDGECGNEKGCARFAGAWRDRKLVAGAMEEPVRRCLRGTARIAAAGRFVRSSRSSVRRGLETAARRTRRVSESPRHLQPRRRR